MLKAQLASVCLNGRDLTLDSIVNVARQFRPVEADAKSLVRVRRSFDMLMRAIRDGEPVYGVNRGVGPYTAESFTQYHQNSEQFNRDLVLSHCAALGPLSSEESVRAAMLVRANMLLFGAAGCQPDVVGMHIALLNEHICPVVPTRASIGESDINILAHIARAMLGEGEVIFRGQRCAAKEALHRAKLEPLKLTGKDGLAIISSNAYSLGSAALLVYDAACLARLADLIFALHLEAFDGNISPLSEQVSMLKGDQWFHVTAARIRRYLRGSFLWKTTRPRLQDPLSFRVAAQVHGVVHEAVARARTKLTRELNSSDDNPAVILAPRKSTVKPTRKTRNAQSGVSCTGNFEPIAVVVELESLCTAIARLANLCCQRMVRLGEMALPSHKFFADSNLTFGFVALQRVFAAVNFEIHQLGSPLLECPALVGDIEDFSSHAPVVVLRLGRALKLVEDILGLELFHASHAVDLRLMHKSPSNFKLASSTRKIYERFRASVPFMVREQSFTFLLNKATRFIRQIAFDSSFIQEVILK